MLYRAPDCDVSARGVLRACARIMRLESYELGNNKTEEKYPCICLNML